MHNSTYSFVTSLKYIHTIMFLVSLVNNLFIQIMYRRVYDRGYVNDARVYACKHIYIYSHTSAYVFTYVHANDRFFLPDICFFFTDMLLST